MADFGIDGVPGGAGDGRDNEPVLADQAVDDRRLAHIGFADDGHPNRVILLFLRFHSLKIAADMVQHVAETGTVGGRDGVGIPDAQVIELIDIRHITAGLVNLVDRQDDRLMGPAQHIRHLSVRVGHALPDIHHKDDDIRHFNGQLGLFPHLGQDNVFGIRFYTACIDQCELIIEPAAVRVDPVPGHAGRILHDRDHLSGHYVKESGFAHIRASYHRNDRSDFSFTHIFTP